MCGKKVPNYIRLFLGYSEQVVIHELTRQGENMRLSSVSDEQVGSTSRRTMVQTKTDKDEMEEVVDEVENVEDIGEGKGEGEEWLEEEVEEVVVEEEEETESEPGDRMELGNFFPHTQPG